MENGSDTGAPAVPGNGGENPVQSNCLNSPVALLPERCGERPKMAGKSTTSKIGGKSQFSPYDPKELRQKRLTLKECEFITHFLETGDATKSMELTEPDISGHHYASHKGYRWLHRENIQQELKLQAGRVLERARLKMVNMGERIVEEFEKAMFEGMEPKTAIAKVALFRVWMDYTGEKAPDKQELTGLQTIQYISQLGKAKEWGKRDAKGEVDKR